jgi:hypothetical protein
MTLQWVRNRDGKLRGVAILLGRGHVEAGRNKEAPWRICDSCISSEAIVFCITDNVYLCHKCLPAHTCPGLCRFLSVSAAREVARAALTETPSHLAVEIWR